MTFIKREEKKRLVNVSTLCESQDVFPAELPCLPPNSGIEFSVDLVRKGLFQQTNKDKRLIRKFEIRSIISFSLSYVRKRCYKVINSGHRSTRRRNNLDANFHKKKSRKVYNMKQLKNDWHCTGRLEDL